MSSQRGNVKKQGPPKHENRMAFKNNLHDTSKKTKCINEVDTGGVCKRCKDIVDWKIKYKKYKPLTRAKKCTRCMERTVKRAYYAICMPCASKLRVCAKCGADKEIVQQTQPTDAEQAVKDTDLKFELNQLCERERRTFFRLQEQGNLGAGAMIGGDEMGQNCSELESSDAEQSEQSKLEGSPRLSKHDDLEDGFEKLELNCEDDNGLNLNVESLGNLDEKEICSS